MSATTVTTPIALIFFFLKFLLLNGFVHNTNRSVLNSLISLLAQPLDATLSELGGGSNAR